MIPKKKSLTPEQKEQRRTANLERRREKARLATDTRAALGGRAPDASAIAKVSNGLNTCLWDQLLILADAYDEEGLHAEAVAYRWLSRNKLAPLRYADHYHWRQNVDAVALPLGHCLPMLATQWLHGRPERISYSFNEFQTIQLAYIAAVAALVGCGIDLREKVSPTQREADHALACHDAAVNHNHFDS